MRQILFSLLLVFAGCAATQTAGDADDNTSNFQCDVRKYGNAPAEAQKFVRGWERRYKTAIQGWTFDPRLLQQATRRHYSSRAYFGQSPAGRPALYFIPVNDRYELLPLTAADRVYMTEVWERNQTTANISNPVQYADGATALQAIRAHQLTDAEPYHGFLIHPGIVNAMAAQTYITKGRIYFTDNPERGGDAAGVFFVAVDSADNELWGLRSFYQDGTTLIPQQCSKEDRKEWEKKRKD